MAGSLACSARETSGARCRCPSDWWTNCRSNCCYGLEPDVTHESNRDVAVLTGFEGGVATALSASGLAKGIKALLEACAADMSLEDGKQLRKASTHWLRHTHGSHALNGRPGEHGGVPIQVVQNNLGHASIGTTSGYLTTERDARLAAMKGFGEKVD